MAMAMASVRVRGSVSTGVLGGAPLPPQPRVSLEARLDSRAKNDALATALIPQMQPKRALWRQERVSYAAHISRNPSAARRPRDARPRDVPDSTDIPLPPDLLKKAILSQNQGPASSDQLSSLSYTPPRPYPGPAVKRPVGLRQAQPPKPVQLREKRTEDPSRSSRVRPMQRLGGPSTPPLHHPASVQPRPPDPAAQRSSPAIWLDR